MKKKLYFISISLIIIYIIGCRRAGSFLVKKDEIKHAYAIVILMGSVTDRILQAVDLYQIGAADTLLLVEGQNDGYRELKARGADMLSSTRQVSNAAVALGIPADNIIVLPGGAKSTQHEATIVRDYLADKSWADTLILVTSAPHMRRSYMIFKNALRKLQRDIHILCCPSLYTDFNAKKWWRRKDDIEIVLMEYIKIANFVLFEKRLLK